MNPVSSYLSSRWLILLALAVGAGGAYGGSLWLEPDPIRVTVGKAVYQDVNASVSTSGRVVPANEFQARASFSGVIEKVFVHVGDHVQPGQMLIRMKDPFAAQRVASATAGLLAAQVSRENVQQGGSQEDRINFAADRKRAQLDQIGATRALAMFQQLQQNGAASPSEVNAAARRLQDADTTLEVLKERKENRYSPADQATWAMRVKDASATLQAEKVGFANANITSPIAGTVNLVPVSAYDFVPAGADLLHLADLSRVEIRAFFDEPDIGKLHVGQQVTVFWDGSAGKSWVGHIKYAPLAVTVSGKRSVGDCTIDVDDPKGELLPNTSVNVSTVYMRRLNVLSIPREALHTDGAATFVFRLVGDRLIQTPVEIGTVNLQLVEVKKGVSSSDVLALHTMDNSVLKDGLRARAVQQRASGFETLPTIAFHNTHGVTATGGKSY